MSPKEYEYNELENMVIKVKSKYRKGKEYGIIILSKADVLNLLAVIDLISSAAETNPKFSEKIESYLHPRFEEIMAIVSTNKDLSDNVNIEISRDNLKDLIKGFEFTSVITQMKVNKISYDTILKNLKDLKLIKQTKK